MSSLISELSFYYYLMYMETGDPNERLINNNAGADDGEAALRDMDGVDFNNPPLRRMRTSLVSRQRMENMQQLEAHNKYLKTFIKDAVWYATIITYLCVCYFVPTLFGLTRDPECEMKAAYANAMFGMILIGMQCILRSGFVIVYFVKKC